MDFRRFSGLRAILSGPAGGVVGYAQTSFDKDKKKPIIGFDMGGTSTGMFGSRIFFLCGTSRLTYSINQTFHDMPARTSMFLRPTPQVLPSRPRSWTSTPLPLVVVRAWSGPTGYSELGRRALVLIRGRHVTGRAAHLQSPMPTFSSADWFQSSSRTSLGKTRTNLSIFS